MDRQKIGKILFWLGVIFTVVWQALTWGQSPIQRVHTAEELSGTIHAVWGALFTLRIIGGSGPALSLVGALLYAGKKGSYSWLLGFLPSFVNFGMYWEPSQYVPALFGIGGTIILLSYFGILWVWTRIYGIYEGAARTGRLIQLLGYSLLVVAGNLLCMYFGNPNQLALVDMPIPSSLIINLTLSSAMLLLFVGHYVVARSSKEATASPSLQPEPQLETTD
jgi:hypothetical protein